MIAMAIQGQVGVRESIERKPWTSEACEVLVFLAQSLGLVGAAVFLYSLGVGLGMTLLIVGLGVWAFLRSQTAEEEEAADEDSRLAAGMDSASRTSGLVWSRNSRLGLPATPVAHPVQRQSA